MSEPLIVVLAGVPVAKGRARFARVTGHAYTPKATSSYEAALRYAAQEAMQGRAPFEGPIDLAIVARLPVPASWSQKKRAAALAGLIYPTKRPDWDNFGKIASDAFNTVVWVDDCQVVSGTVSKRYHPIPSLSIRVTELSN